MSTEQPAPEQPAEQPADDVEIRSFVDPATVRRAPRYKPFFIVGVVAGIVIGLAFGEHLLNTFVPGRDLPLGKPGVWLTVVVMGTTALTTLITGVLLITIDRRSMRRHDAKRGV
ncbi:MAG: hypothetical protein FWF90_12870 [Promicromonosporaceae bacterium]|nr:hypothetical protein [Promicromonosporaceae bacterium]